MHKQVFATKTLLALLAITYVACQKASFTKQSMVVKKTGTLLTVTEKRLASIKSDINLSIMDFPFAYTAIYSDSLQLDST